jgi:hypothetical protein
MIFILLAISAVFVAVAFLLTERNARYMLSGYNAMTEEEKSKVDIKKLIPYFRNFHIFLGVSFLVISLLLISYVNLTVGTVFICVYPVVAEIYFVLSVRKFSNNQ